MYKELLQEIRSLISQDSTTDEKLKAVCSLLHNSIEYYNWVGFYFNDDTHKVLNLGPYVGERTEHTQIPYGKGICGQVANSHETFLVEDVHSQDNYIACSIDVKSEIVVPMFKNGKLIGQIDIDSNTIAAFTNEDESFLKEVCALCSQTL